MIVFYLLIPILVAREDIYANVHSPISNISFSKSNETVTLNTKKKISSFRYIRTLNTFKIKIQEELTRIQKRVQTDKLCTNEQTVYVKV